MLIRTIAAAALALTMAAQSPAAELGDDGLHKPDWLRDTLKDMREDLAKANAEGKRLLIAFEQRGCVYCTQMHESVFPDPRVSSLIRHARRSLRLFVHS